MKGTGAFWNMFGSMQEIQLPVFVLINVAMKAYGKTHPALAEKLKAMTLSKAKAFMKLCNGPNPPKPCESYHPTLLGQASMDSRGHLPLETFLKESLILFKKQRLEDALGLNTVFQTWDTEKDSSFDAFSSMVLHAKPDMSEREALELYQMATDDPDEKVRMAPLARPSRADPHVWRLRALVLLCGYVHASCCVFVLTRFIWNSSTMICARGRLCSKSSQGRVAEVLTILMQLV